MKRKIFSILAILVLSFGLVTAVPAGADGDPALCEASFRTETGDSTAEWSTDQKNSGSYSVKLGVVDPVADLGAVYVYLPPTPLSSFSNPTFYAYGVIEGSAEKLNTGENQRDGGYWNHGPYLNIMLDMNGNGVWDGVGEGEGNDDVLEGVIADAVAGEYDPESFVKMEGVDYYDSDDSLETNDFDNEANTATLDYWQGKVGVYDVLGVYVMFGWSSHTDANQVVYIDDVTIGTTIYDLEPRVINTTQTKGFNTIQDAIDCASEGETISVTDGTYTENLVIATENITVQAASSPVIDGGGMLGPGVHITAADVTFQGFTITNFTCDPYAPPEYPSGAGIGAIWATGDGVVIDGNIIYNIRSTAAPEDLTDPDMWPAGIGIDVAASDVEVTNNTVHDVDSIGIRVRSNYEEVWPGDTLMSGILVEGNTVYNTHNSGVLIAGVVTNVTIKGNQIYNSLPPTPYSLLVVAGASAVGVPNNVLIEGNTIYGSYGNVCLGSVTNITVTGNTITGAIPHYTNPDTKGKNIYIRDWTEVTTANVTITNNDILGADGYGVNIKGNVDVSTITINFNNIFGNTDYGVLNEIATDVDAENNWWGMAAGPYEATTNPGVTAKMGNAVSTYVDYTPWLYFTTVANGGDSLANIIANEVPAYAQSVVLSSGWNTFSVPIALDGQYNNWDELYDLTSANYSMAYRFDPATPRHSCRWQPTVHMP